MKIVRKMVPEKTIEEFAEQYGLVMEVCERGSDRLPGVPMFYAHFQNVEIKDGSTLISSSGNADTEEAAIYQYGKEISEKIIVVDAMKPTRREIIAPRIVARS